MVLMIMRTQVEQSIMVAQSSNHIVMMPLSRAAEAATSAPTVEDGKYIPGRMAGVHVISRHQLQNCRYWQQAFASQHKDHRYYEIVGDTLHPEFDYLYFAFRDSRGEVRAVQPFFILDQDILAGARPYVGRMIDVARR